MYDLLRIGFKSKQKDKYIPYTNAVTSDIPNRRIGGMKGMKTKKIQGDVSKYNRQIIAPKEFFEWDKEKKKSYW